MESPELRAAIAKYSPILVEARRRLVLTFLAFGIAAVAGFVLYEQIIKFLIELLSLEGINIVFTSPFQFINLAVACGVAVGVLVTVPLLVIQVLSFLLPALKKREYVLISRLLPLSIGLFVVGFGFGVAIMKWQIEIFLERSLSLGIGNILDISSLLSTVLVTAVVMGVGFQFPIVLIVLMRFGLIERQQLSRQRLWIYLGVFVVSMLLPADSILTDLLLSLPLVLLFELTLLIGRKK